MRFASVFVSFLISVSRSPGIERDVDREVSLLAVEDHAADVVDVYLSNGEVALLVLVLGWLVWPLRVV